MAEVAELVNLPKMFTLLGNHGFWVGNTYLNVTSLCVPGTYYTITESSDYYGHLYNTLVVAKC